METLRNRSRLAIVMLLTVLFAPGCFPSLRPFDKYPIQSAEPVCHLVAIWQHEVVFAPDPANGGASTPGIAGRLYLFGKEINCPVPGEGSVVVDLYVQEPPSSDNAKPAAGPPQLRLLEEWRLDQTTLKQLLRKDVIGMGNTLFLPWGTYKPEITQVHLKIRYEAAQGAPLFADSGPLTLSGSKGKIIQTRKLGDNSAVTQGNKAGTN